MSMIILDLLVYYPHLQVKIFNCFDKLSAMIYVHSTYVAITAEASLPRGTIERLIHSCLKMKKVISRWVPHQLTNEQRVKL